MKIIINADDLKNLMLFTSKSKEKSVLNGISFKNNNGILEMTATDRMALLLIKRKLQDDEELKNDIILKFPKLHYKNTYTIIEDAGKYFIKNEKEKRILSKIESIFPNYEQILLSPNTPLASEFTLFSSENIKRLEAVFQAGLFTPVAKYKKYAHSWEKGQYTVLLMPVKF